MGTVAVLIILAVSFVLLTIYTVHTVQYRDGGRKEMLCPATYPKVSILKPVKSIDDNLEQNLESFYSLNYPRYEIIFGVDSLSDDVVCLLQKMKQKYYPIATKIVETGTKKRMNPKIDTLAKMAAECDGDLYWVSDSNTRVMPDTLRKLTAEYTATGAKIVFSPILGSGGKTFGSIMENAYLNLFVSGNIISAWKCFHKPIIVGKSMLIEKMTLNDLGGFEHFREYLAEDYCMGEIYMHRHLPVATNYTWITNYNSKTTIKEFCGRVSRWAKMRYHIDTKYYLMEILANPLFIALVFAFLLGRNGIRLLVASFIVKTILEYINLCLINKEDRENDWILAIYPIVIILKDLLLGIIYFVPFVSSTVCWRGRKIAIGRKSRIIEGYAS